MDWKSEIQKKICSHSFGRQYLTDVFFRTEISMYRGVFVNLLYIIVKMFSGIFYHSFWMFALAVYYILLAVMRCSLLHYMKRQGAGKDEFAELCRYRLCGVILLFMNQALTVIVILIVYQNQIFLYPGALIYAMAAYAFYNIAVAVMNMVKIRKHGSYVMAAAKMVNLVAAMVSMLSLTVALMARFGEGASLFAQFMSATVGGVVCMTVLGMALFMIVRSTERIGKLRNGVQT